MRNKEWSGYNLEEEQLRNAYNRGDFNYGEFKNRLSLIRSKREQAKQKRKTEMGVSGNNYEYIPVRADELRAGDKVPCLQCASDEVSTVAYVSEPYEMCLGGTLLVDVRIEGDERNFIYAADKVFQKELRVESPQPCE